MKNNIYLRQDNLIYKANESEQRYGCIEWNLELICGIDYIDPDENNTQGWIESKNFIKKVQNDVLLQDYMEESFKEAIENNNYELVKKLPIIFKKK